MLSKDLLLYSRQDLSERIYFKGSTFSLATDFSDRRFDFFGYGVRVEIARKRPACSPDSPASSWRPKLKGKLFGEWSCFDLRISASDRQSASKAGQRSISFR
jgi:hypothetical protein